MIWLRLAAVKPSYSRATPRSSPNRRLFVCAWNFKRSLDDGTRVLWDGIAERFGGHPGSMASVFSGRIPEGGPSMSEPIPKEPSGAKVPPQEPPSLRLPEDSTVIEALAQSMRQLQQLQLKAFQKDSPSEETPEAVKTSVATLAVLGLPEGDQSGLLFQDWLVQITTAMQDLSSGSGGWWELVKTSVMNAYETWLAVTPLERLGIEPQNSSE